MPRRILLVAALLALGGLSACDRTDTAFGDDGVVRIGVAVDDLVPVPSGERVGLTFAMGHVPDTEQVVVSTIRPDGTTEATEQLPSTFTARRATGAVSHFSEPRDPDLRVYVAGERGGHLAVAGLGNTYRFSDTAVTLGRDATPAAAASEDGTVSVVANDVDQNLVVSRISPDGVAAAARTIALPLRARDVELLADGSLLIAGTWWPRTSDTVCDGDCQYAVLKLTPDLQPDPSFGRDGVAIVDMGGNDEGWSMAVTDARIVVAGLIVRPGESSHGADRYQQGIVALTHDGELDGSFGLYARSIVEGLFGRPGIVAGGPGYVTATVTGGRATTVGLTGVGHVERSWGEDGIQVDFPGGDASGSTVVAVPAEPCRHGVCTGPRRIIVAARTTDAPGGVLLGLKP